MSEPMVQLAEREYQRLLAILQATRAELDEVDAALRRHGIDRPQFTPDEADAIATRLETRRNDLAGRAATQHAAARAQRDRLNHLRGTGDPEPTELPPEPSGPPAGYLQPPFAGPLR